MLAWLWTTFKGISPELVTRRYLAQSHSECTCPPRVDVGVVDKYLILNDKIHKINIYLAFCVCKLPPEQTPSMSALVVHAGYKHGCQLVYFQTKNPNAGKFLKILIHFMAIWNILQIFGIFYDPFGTFCVHLIHFSGFGAMHLEKSGNPGYKKELSNER
jgi:hypothetical protein